MNRIYTPASHLAVVGHMLLNAGMQFQTRIIVGVAPRRFHELAGLHGCMFAYVENHPIPVESELLNFVRAHGFIVMKLDDSAARARAVGRWSEPRIGNGEMQKRAEFYR